MHNWPVKVCFNDKAPHQLQTLSEHLGITGCRETGFLSKLEAGGIRQIQHLYFSVSCSIPAFGPHTELGGEMFEITPRMYTSKTTYQGPCSSVWVLSMD